MRLRLPVLASCLVLASAALAPAAEPLSAKDNFEKHCVDCHGADGRSQTRLGKKSGAKNLSDKTEMTKVSDEEIFKAIKFGRKDKQGREKMDAFGTDLSDKEITELVGFVRALAK